ncbi:hypothetical protein [Aliiroseovarius sp. YM-037]|uniref:hypothetical protein n=1 Tax=Aliiroseovarius sp. YM-037 TaxID=3341728 RepID=UPI003A8106D7
MKVVQNTPDKLVVRNNELGWALIPLPLTILAAVLVVESVLNGGFSYVNAFGLAIGLTVSYVFLRVSANRRIEFDRTRSLITISKTSIAGRQVITRDLEELDRAILEDYEGDSTMARTLLVFNKAPEKLPLSMTSDHGPWQKKTVEIINSWLTLSSPTLDSTPTTA